MSQWREDDVQQFFFLGALYMDAACATTIDKSLPTA
jgi:hypothetical protein